MPTFDTVGQHTYTVPSGAETIVVECWGAQGGSGPGTGGLGGYASGEFDAANLPSTLEVFVGGQPSGSSGGFNGGGDGESPSSNADGQGGGGASDVRESASDLQSRLVVGAGGGGAPGSTDASVEVDGGDGGGDVGDAGENGVDNILGETPADGGGGGTQSAGGAGGDDNVSQNYHNPGSDGALGTGGAGGEVDEDRHANGGGGGGGYYGGGGGGSGRTAGGAGGGGSSLGASTTTGVQSGNGQVVIVAVPPAPQNPTVDAERASEIDLSWGGVSSADEYRVYRHDAADPYVNGGQVATVPDDGSATYTHTDSGLTNGRQYHYQIVAVATSGDNAAESDPSSEVQGSTLLPSPSIDDTDPTDSQIGLLYSLPDDNPAGDVEVYRSTDGSLGSVVTTITDLTTTAYTDSGLTTGETYHYTLRRDTGDATADSAQVQETASFRPVLDATIDSVSTQSIDLSWKSDSSWTGQTEIWRDREGYDYNDPKGSQIDTVGDSVLSYSDSGLDPERSYTYTIVAATDSSGDVAADPVTTTTDSEGARQTVLPKSGWLVELDHPGGRTLRPTLLENTQRSPAIRDLYRATAHVPLDDKWQDSSFQQVPARAWAEKERLPIEQLDKVGETRGQGTARNELTLLGGVDLRTRVETEVESKPVHEFVEQLVQNNTDLTPNVDAPQASTTTDTFLDPDSASEWASALTNTDLSSVPLEVVNGGIQTQQSCWTIEGESPDRSSGSSFTEGANYSGSGVTDGAGAAQSFDGVGEYAEYDVTLGYDIAEEHVGFRVLGDMGQGVSIRVEIDGIEYTTTGTSFAFGTGLWVDLNDSWGGGGLAAGDHTIGIECVDDTGSGYLELDVLALFDSRYSYTFDTSVTTNANGNNYLHGPEPMPVIDATLDRVPSVLSVAGVEIASTWDDTTDGQAIGVRNEAGGSFVSSANTTSVDETFAELGALLDVRLTLGRYGSRTSTPATGFEGQRVESLTATVDLDTTPLAINRSIDDTILSIAQRLARESNSVFGIGWDGSGLTFEWTQLGQRDGGSVLEVETVSQDRDDDHPERVIVYGGNQEIRQESLVADVGNSKSLNNARLAENSEFVRKASDGTGYERGDDYEISWQDGTITALAGGQIADGESLLVDYSYQPRASWSIQNPPAEPREVVEYIPELSSDRACGLAAYRIVQETGEPLHSATVRLPQDTDVDVVEAIDSPELQADSYELRAIESTAQGTQLTLGNRQRVRDVVQDIQSRLGSLSEQT